MKLLWVMDSLTAEEKRWANCKTRGISLPHPSEKILKYFSLNIKTYLYVRACPAEEVKTTTTILFLFAKLNTKNYTVN